MAQDTTQRWLVTGATGFIGRRLIESLLVDGISAIGLSRQPKDLLTRKMPKVQWLNDFTEIADTTPTHIVNLAGAGIADARWTPTRKAEIWQSRIDFSQQLSQSLAALPAPPALVVSGSAIGYYGTGSSACTEDSSAGHGFSAELCQAWEAAITVPDSRMIHLRIGVVLGQGGMLAKLKPVYQMGLGGRLGTGDQMLSWIQRDDLVHLIRWLAERNGFNGAVNATAPNPINQRRFAQHFARALKRPALFPAPALSMRLIYGEMAEELLLSGQTVLPNKALKAGFTFAYPWICKALSTSLQSESQSWWPMGKLTSPPINPLA